MKKKYFIITIFIILTLAFGLLFWRLNGLKKENDIEVVQPETLRFEKLKNALLASSTFENSTITTNANQELVNVDGKYDIVIKSGFYSMTIKDQKLEKGYCEIVDAIEQSLGLEVGQSIETCEKTLAGMINLGGINVELFDTYKVLTVSSENIPTLFSTTNNHIEKDLISIDEINYNIKLDNYLFTSMSEQYDSTKKEYSLCGNVYNSKKTKNKEFIFKLYDENKNELEKKYIVMKTTQKNMYHFV